MAASPVVDGLESQFAGRLTVVRLNVQDPSAGPWLSRFAFQATPTFIFLDGSGEELWRSIGSIDPQQVAQALAAP